MTKTYGDKIDSKGILMCLPLSYGMLSAVAVVRMSHGIHQVTESERTYKIMAGERLLAIESLQTTIRSLTETVNTDVAAVAVLQDVYTTEKPTLSDAWETAIISCSAGRISGVSWEIYSSDGQLRGISLFDAHGHHGSSAALTMIARATAANQFSIGTQDKLGDVLRRITTEISCKLPGLKGKLTGTLVRIDNDVIEFVCTGQPAPVIFHLTNGKYNVVEKGISSEIKPVSGEESDIGIYETVRHRLVKDDVLVLFSSGVLNIENVLGSSYGNQRFLSVFEGITPFNAQKIADEVMADLIRFIHPDQVMNGERAELLVTRCMNDLNSFQFNQDCTLIIVRRTE